MTTEMNDVTVIGGVDTNDAHAPRRSDRWPRPTAWPSRVPGNRRGYGEFLVGMTTHGTVLSVGVESTGSFGASLTRSIRSHDVEVIEVNEPNRAARRNDGKSDRLDAERVARAVLSRTCTAVPKTKSGIVEVIMTLRVKRSGAVKARTQAFNTLWGIMIAAPSPLRDELIVLTKRTLVNRCMRLRPETDELLTLAATTTDSDTRPSEATQSGALVYGDVGTTFEYTDV